MKSETWPGSNAQARERHALSLDFNTCPEYDNKYDEFDRDRKESSISNSLNFRCDEFIAKLLIVRCLVEDDFSLIEVNLMARP